MLYLARLADTTTTGSTGSSLLMIGSLAVVFVIFYFFFMRPQKKQEKEQTQMRNSLRVGDEITTIGGIIGKVVSIKDPTVLIETGRDGTKIRILKSAIKSVDVPAAATMAQPEEKTEETPAELTDGSENASEDTGDKKSKKKKK